jgi:hypothetical protein
VTAGDVGDQLVEQIALIGDALRTKVPEVVMGVADRELRLQRQFLSKSQSVIASVWHTEHLRSGVSRRAQSTGPQVVLRQDKQP